MFFGLTFEKLIMLAVIAGLLLGPERLPKLAAQFAHLVARVRDMTSSAKVQLKEELGPDVDLSEWRRLDPRQYDPRRIVREALIAPPAKPATPPTKPTAPPAKPSGSGTPDDPDRLRDGAQ